MSLLANVTLILFILAGPKSGSAPRPSAEIGFSKGGAGQKGIHVTGP